MNASGGLNTCKSNGNGSFGKPTSGERVRNAYATYLQLGHSPKKFGLIPHNLSNGIRQIAKFRRLEMGMRQIS